MANRLPIVQGGTFSYLIPSFAILSMPEFECPSGFKESKKKYHCVFVVSIFCKSIITMRNEYIVDFVDPKNSTFDGIWKKRMLEVTEISPKPAFRQKSNI